MQREIKLSFQGADTGLISGVDQIRLEMVSIAISLRVVINVISILITGIHKLYRNTFLGRRTSGSGFTSFPRTINIATIIRRIIHNIEYARDVFGRRKHARPRNASLISPRRRRMDLRNYTARMQLEISNLKLCDPLRTCCARISA